MRVEMNEKDLIRVLTAKLPVNQNTIVPAGDDCAAVGGFDGDSSLLLKTDAIVEGVHFKRSDSPELVGRKALARCLSDIAAMGGEPDSALVTIGFPSDESVEFLEKAYDGLIELAAEFGVAVVGGETTRNPGGIFISVTLTGTTFKAFHSLRQLILQERLSMFTECSRLSIKLTHCSRGR